MANIKETIKAMPNCVILNNWRVDKCDCDICGKTEVNCKEVTSLDETLELYDRTGKLIKSVHECWMACADCRELMWEFDILHR